MSRNNNEYVDYSHNAEAASNVPTSPPSSQFGMMTPDDDQPSGRGLRVLRSEQSLIDQIRLRSQLAEGNRKIVGIRIRQETEKVLIASELDVATTRAMADTQLQMICDREGQQKLSNRNASDEGVSAEFDRAMKDIEASDLSKELKEWRIARLKAALKRYSNGSPD